MDATRGQMMEDIFITRKDPLDTSDYDLDTKFDEARPVALHDSTLGGVPGELICRVWFSSLKL